MKKILSISEIMMVPVNFNGKRDKSSCSLYAKEKRRISYHKIQEMLLLH